MTVAKSPSISLRRRTRNVFVLAVLASVVAVFVGWVAFASLLRARSQVIERVDPAIVQAERLSASLVDQEIGVRTFVLTGIDTFLARYEQGRTDEALAAASLRSTLPDSAAASDALGDVLEAAKRWRDDYAEPTIATVHLNSVEPRAPAALQAGRDSFNKISASVDRLESVLGRLRADARRDLGSSTNRLIGVVIAASIVTVGAVASLWGTMRRSVQKPLDHLREDANRVAAGDVDHPVSAVGPSEMHELAVAMEAMRTRIVAELRASVDARVVLEQRTAELARSNAELEQFAYIASHDLQEPLRKVASFCQLLQSRYGGELDARADQYIEFAVDGAKRMQALINDLLAFSRVGRVTTEFTAVELDMAFQLAMTNLASAIADANAVVHCQPLPTVIGECALLVAVFQNLIGNAVKFRRPDESPVIDITFRSADGCHEVTVHDDGIGIEPEYADRVFVIFQRLHPKDQYEGTGIGLSLCRKIVEYHGGRIWADTTVSTGTTIRFTLPEPRSQQDGQHSAGSSDRDPARRG